MHDDLVRRLRNYPSITGSDRLDALMTHRNDCIAAAAILSRTCEGCKHSRRHWDDGPLTCTDDVMSAYREESLRCEDVKVCGRWETR